MFMTKIKKSAACALALAGVGATYIVSGHGASGAVIPLVQPKPIQSQSKRAPVHPIDPLKAALNAATTQPDMNRISYKMYLRSNHEVNLRYQRLLAKIGNKHNPLPAKRLKESQKAWLKYRDAEAKFRANADFGEDGSGFPMAFNLAAVDICHERLKALNDVEKSLAQH
ncbi:MAG: hypothetical protein JWQ02_2484 [Capsulimonas sp.]|nr:hypothetical protein [Capsulimonas sp.]